MRDVILSEQGDFKMSKYEKMGKEEYLANRKRCLDDIAKAEKKIKSISIHISQVSKQWKNDSFEQSKRQDRKYAVLRRDIQFEKEKIKNAKDALERLENHKWFWQRW